MLENLTRDDFKRHLEEKFTIHVGEGEDLETELIEVSHVGEPRKTKDGEEKRRTFAIVFRGPSGHLLEQQIYAVHHAELGTLELFLVTIGPDEHGMCYEAVFN